MEHQDSQCIPFFPNIITNYSEERLHKYFSQKSMTFITNTVSSPVALIQKTPRNEFC